MKRLILALLLVPALAFGQATRDVQKNAARQTANVETISADKTLTYLDAEYQIITPSGSGLSIILPSSSVKKGQIRFQIQNAGVNDLTVKASSGAAVWTIISNASALIVANVDTPTTAANWTVQSPPKTTQTDKITNAAGTGSPSFPQGLTANASSSFTAASFSGAVSALGGIIPRSDGTMPSSTQVGYFVSTPITATGVGGNSAVAVASLNLGAGVWIVGASVSGYLTPNSGSGLCAGRVYINDSASTMIQDLQSINQMGSSGANDSYFFGANPTGPYLSPSGGKTVTAYIAAQLVSGTLSCSINSRGAGTLWAVKIGG